MDTTHPTCRDYRDDKIAWAKDLNKEGMFDSFEFVKLKVIGDAETSTDGDDDEEGYLEFEVTMRGRNQEEDTILGGKRFSAAAVSGLETVVRERSQFLKENGVWLYASGDVTSKVAGLEDTKLNL